MEKNKYSHILNVVEMRWKIMGELKWSLKVMWTPKIKEKTCSNKIEFLALKEKIAYLEIRICEINAHLRRLGRIFGRYYCGKLFSHGLPPIYICHSIIKFEFGTQGKKKMMFTCQNLIFTLGIGAPFNKSKFLFEIVTSCHLFNQFYIEIGSNVICHCHSLLGFAPNSLYNRATGSHIVSCNKLLGLRKLCHFVLAYFLNTIKTLRISDWCYFGVMRWCFFILLLLCLISYAYWININLCLPFCLDWCV